MKTKQHLFVVSITFAFLIACQALTPPFTNENSTPTQTQETIAQPTTTMPFETSTTEGNINSSSTESLDADYFLTDDAYNVVNNENRTLEFYTNMSFDDIEDYYRKELPLRGYTERFVDAPRPVEGCSQMVFDGDSSGKELIIMTCIIFQTEEHWVSISFGEDSPQVDSQPALQPTFQATLPPVTQLNSYVTGETVDEYNVPMMLVPEGEFVMGINDGKPDQSPRHNVYLDEYYIDKYEVTNAAYKLCVNSSVCSLPVNSSSYTRVDYYKNPDFDNYPVIYVDWNMAKTYCAWRGAKLPTEAQWEKAARGVDGRAYPWGEGINETISNYGSYVGDTTVVGSYESDKSPYGVYDMAGNVIEMVSDLYSETYYQNSPYLNPLGPVMGELRVSRGGSWRAKDIGAFSFLRRKAPSMSSSEVTGFRCAKEVTP